MVNVVFRRFGTRHVQSYGDAVSVQTSTLFTRNSVFATRMLSATLARMTTSVSLLTVLPVTGAVMTTVGETGSRGVSERLTSYGRSVLRVELTSTVWAAFYLFTRSVLTADAMTSTSGELDVDRRIPVPGP